jgi:N-acetylmuramoyl-L-alanine amidase-like protein
VRPFNLFWRRRWIMSLIAIAFAISAAITRTPEPVAAPPALPLVAPTAAALRPSTTPAAPAQAPARRPTTPPTARPTATPAPSPTPSVQPTPTPRPAGTPPRVGIQVGHWLSSELPDELARLRGSTGAFAAGYAEVDVNLNVARRVVRLLESDGIVVDLLPATIPAGYDADAFVALHADGSPSSAARGFKLATPWRTSRASQQLLDTLTAEYAAVTGMPQDGAITFNMRGYYAFSYQRHRHAIAKTTPAVIVEMGFLTNSTDRALLIDQPDNLAVGIANGIVRYLNERDPRDGAALIPPSFAMQRPSAEAGVDVRAAPREDAAVLLHVPADARLVPFQERNGWYQVFVRGGQRVVGWVRKDALVTTNEPLPAPPPSTNP